MDRPKRVMIFYSVFCVWYVLTGAVYQFVNIMPSFLGKLLIALSPVMWIGSEGASSILFVCAPIAFFIAAILIALLPAFTKRQKITAAVLPAGAYALFLGMEILAHRVVTGIHII